MFHTRQIIREYVGAMRCLSTKFDATRLETRTKESTHIRKYACMILARAVNVIVVMFPQPRSTYIHGERFEH